MAQSSRDQVFIGYSHEDEKWLKRRRKCTPVLRQFGVSRLNRIRQKNKRDTAIK